MAVAAEDVHHLVRVDAELAADAAHLVAEDYLEGMEGVVDILHDLGHTHVGGDELARERAVELMHDLGGALRVGADERQRRVEKILHRGALAQKFGIGHHGEVLVALQAGLLPDDLAHTLVGAGHHGGADSHDMK